MTTVIGSVFTLVAEALLLFVLVRVGRGLFSDGVRLLKPIGCGVLLLIGALSLLALAGAVGGASGPSRTGSGPQAVVSPKAVEE